MATVSMEQPSKNEAGTVKKEVAVDGTQDFCARMLPFFASVLILADLAIIGICAWDIISRNTNIDKFVQEVILTVVLFVMAFIVMRLGKDSRVLQLAATVIAALCIFASAGLLMALALPLIASPVVDTAFSHLPDDFRWSIYLIVNVSVLLVTFFGFFLQKIAHRSTKPFALGFLFVLTVQAVCWAVLFAKADADTQLPLDWKFAQNLFLLFYTLFLAGGSWLLPYRAAQQNQSK